jgi:hypothetical protein
LAQVGLAVIGVLGGGGGGGPCCFDKTRYHAHPSNCWGRHLTFWHATCCCCCPCCSGT